MFSIYKSKGKYTYTLNFCLIDLIYSSKNEKIDDFLRDSCRFFEIC